MTDTGWDLLEEVPGPFQAEILRGLLEAQEIPTLLLQEGVGRAVGFTVGPLGVVQIFIPSNKMKQAVDVLNDYYAGKLAIQDSFEDHNDLEPE